MSGPPCPPMWKMRCFPPHIRGNQLCKNHAHGLLLLGTLPDEHPYRNALGHGNSQIPAADKIKFPQEDDPPAGAAVLIAGYGIYAFFHREIGTYMTLRTAFVFFDFAEPLALFFLDYLAVMGLFAKAHTVAI